MIIMVMERIDRTNRSNESSERIDRTNRANESNDRSEAVRWSERATETLRRESATVFDARSVGSNDRHTLHHPRRNPKSRQLVRQPAAASSSQQQPAATSTNQQQPAAASLPAVTFAMPARWERVRSPPTGTFAMPAMCDERDACQVRCSLCLPGGMFAMPARWIVCDAQTLGHFKLRCLPGIY